MYFGNNMAILENDNVIIEIRIVRLKYIGNFTFDEIIPRTKELIIKTNHLKF